MEIRNLTTDNDKDSYKEMFDISLGTNYSGLLFPSKKFPFHDENLFGAFVDDKLVSALFLVDYTIKASSRIRIINVKEVLRKLSYSIPSFDISIKVIDPYCNWNNRIFFLSSKNGEITITDKDHTKREVDLSIEITALAELVTGSRSITDLSEFSRCTVKTESIGMFKKLFPRQNNYFRDFF